MATAQRDYFKTVQVPSDKAATNDVRVSARAENQIVRPSAIQLKAALNRARAQHGNVLRELAK